MSIRGYEPKKSLGQHFLHDMNIARKIVAELAPDTEDTVLEIGPGQGVLTALLAETGASIIAADIDQRSIAWLREKFPAEAFPRLELLHADILAMDLVELRARSGAPLRLIGNLPYNITSQILFRIFESPSAVRDAVFMMQREVADRIVSSHGGKEYGILSVMTQLHAKVRRCFHVSPNVFVPKPNVWSSVVHFEFHDTLLAEIKNYSFFRTLVKTTFGKRRKTIANALRFAEIDASALPPDCLPYLALRPEQLSVGDFIILSNNLQKE